MTKYNEKCIRTHENDNARKKWHESKASIVHTYRYHHYTNSEIIHVGDISWKGFETTKTFEMFITRVETH